MKQFCRCILVPRSQKRKVSQSLTPNRGPIELNMCPAQNNTSLMYSTAGRSLFINNECNEKLVRNRRSTLCTLYQGLLYATECDSLLNLKDNKSCVYPVKYIIITKFKYTLYKHNWLLLPHEIVHMCVLGEK